MSYLVGPRVNYLVFYSSLETPCTASAWPQYHYSNLVPLQRHIEGCQTTRQCDINAFVVANLKPGTVLMSLNVPLNFVYITDGSGVVLCRQYMRVFMEYLWELLFSLVWSLIPDCTGVGLMSLEEVWDELTYKQLISNIFWSDSFRNLVLQFSTKAFIPTLSVDLTSKYPFDFLMLLRVCHNIKTK